MKLVENHIATQQKTPIRFQEYAVGIFQKVPTKSAVKKAIKKKLIFIDGDLATTSLHILGGEKIELFEKNKSVKTNRLKLDLKVLFEDDYLAIICKPAGILVSGNSFVTITNGLAQNLQKSNQIDTVTPQPVHRLDYPTSGLLLVGKTAASIQKLGELFATKNIKKTYTTITIGKMKTKGNITFQIDNKEALTEYTLLESAASKRFERLNLVKLSPKTGRKHQLRKHLLAIGNPILGDKDYFLKDNILYGKGLYLHATSLEFIHPFTKETILVTQDLPPKFQKIFD